MPFKKALKEQSERLFSKRVGKRSTSSLYAPFKTTPPSTTPGHSRSSSIMGDRKGSMAGPKSSTGVTALSDVNSPPEFSAQCSLITFDLCCAMAIRGSDPVQLYAHTEVMPKPVFVKAKTNKKGPCAGAIVEDVENLGSFGELAVSLEEQYKKIKEVKEELAEQVRFMPFKIPLSRILENKKEYKLVCPPNEKNINDPEDYIATYGQLCFEWQKVIYKIDLNNSARQAEPPPDMQEEKQVRTVPPGLFSQPDWWDEARFGKFKEKAQWNYPLEYKVASSKEPFQPVNACYVRVKMNGKTNYLLVTGDMDILWITRPSPSALKKRAALVFHGKNEVHPLPAVCHEVLNTFPSSNPYGVAQLEQARLILKGFDARATVLGSQEEMVGRLGCVTAHQARVIADVNAAFKSCVPHIDYLFQHSAENQNPGVPSDLNTPMLHFYNGQIIKTTNEEDLVNFLLKRKNYALYEGNYLEDNIFDIHPRWNMKLWAPVIEKQIRYRHPLKSETLQSYLNYIKDKKSVEYKLKIKAVNQLIKEAKQREDALKLLSKTPSGFVAADFSFPIQAALKERLQLKMELGEELEMKYWAPVIERMLNAYIEVPKQIYIAYQAYLQETRESIYELLKNTEGKSDALLRDHLIDLRASHFLVGQLRPLHNPRVDAGEMIRALTAKMDLVFAPSGKIVNESKLTMKGRLSAFFNARSSIKKEKMEDPRSTVKKSKFRV
jgi:hypothetical protein